MWNLILEQFQNDLVPSKAIQFLCRRCVASPASDCLMSINLFLSHYPEKKVSSGQSGMNEPLFI